MNDEYTAREIDAMFKVIDTKLDALIVQTTRTNGRCNTLEDEVSGIKAWQSALKGGLAVLTTLVVPVLIFAINQYLHSK